MDIVRMGDKFYLETTNLTIKHPPMSVDAVGGGGGAKGGTDNVHSFVTFLYW